MPKPKPMPGRSHPKASPPSDASLVRHWLASDRDDEQFDLFEDGVERLLHDRGISFDRLQAIVSRVRREDAPLIREDIERVATQPVLPGAVADGRAGTIFGELFGIPLTGALPAVEELCASGTISVLAGTVALSGFAPAQATLIAYPVALSSEDLATVSPNLLDVVARNSTLALCAEAGSVGEGRATQALEALRQLRAAHAGASSGADEPVVTRVLLCALAYAPREDEEQDLHGLAILSNGPEDAAEEALLDGYHDRWFEGVGEAIEQHAVIISSPLPWNMLRSALLSIELDVAINGALTSEGAAERIDEVEIELDLQPEAIMIRASLEGRTLITRRFDYALLPGGLDEFLQEITDRYRLAGQGEAVRARLPH